VTRFPIAAITIEIALEPRGLLTALIIAAHIQRMEHGAGTVILAGETAIAVCLGETDIFITFGLTEFVSGFAVQGQTAIHHTGAAVDIGHAETSKGAIIIGRTFRRRQAQSVIAAAGAFHNVIAIAVRLARRRTNLPQYRLTQIVIGKQLAVSVALGLRQTEVAGFKANTALHFRMAYKESFAVVIGAATGGLPFFHFHFGDNVFIAVNRNLRITVIAAGGKQ